MRLYDQYDCFLLALPGDVALVEMVFTGGGAGAALELADATSMDLDDSQSCASNTIASAASLPDLDCVASPQPPKQARATPREQKMSQFVDAPQDPLNCILMMLVM